MKIEKILVPTDFSKEADSALEAAVEIASRQNAAITLLHVVDLPVVAYPDGYSAAGQIATEGDTSAHKTYTHKLTEQAKQQLARLVAVYPDANIAKKIAFDSFSRHLSEFVSKNQTDLIVMGSKGASGIKEVLVGSNTERVIRTAKVPVLTIKGATSVTHKKIVFASDFKHISLKATEVVKHFAELFGGELHLLKIITANTFETTPESHELINGFASKNDIENYTGHVYNYYSEEEGIKAFCNEINADLLALTTHGRRGLAHMFLGSIAEEVANHSDIPVLTFNQHFRG